MMQISIFQYARLDLKLVWVSVGLNHYHRDHWTALSDKSYFGFNFVSENWNTWPAAWSVFINNTTTTTYCLLPPALPGKHFWQSRPQSGLQLGLTKITRERVLQVGGGSMNTNSYFGSSHLMCCINILDICEQSTLHCSGQHPALKHSMHVFINWYYRKNILSHRRYWRCWWYWGCWCWWCWCCEVWRSVSGAQQLYILCNNHR